MLISEIMSQLMRVTANAACDVIRTSDAENSWPIYVIPDDEMSRMRGISDKLSVTDFGNK